MMAEYEITESTELEEKFSRAANHVRSLVTDLDNGQLLGLYGLYKQATVGKCEEPRPSWYRTQAKYKWESWNNLGDMSKENAMENYIRAVGKLDPSWERNSRVAAAGCWTAVSRMSNMDEELRDSEKTLLDWVKDGDEERVRSTLAEYGATARVNDADDDGMMPIHWAADRGQLETLKHLVEAGANLNARDLNGQTALHYAASCCHTEVVAYLLSLGAESLEDNEGMTPKDVADQQLVAMF